MADMFEGLLNNQESSPFEILKALISKENIETISDLDIEQIQVFCNMYWFALLSDPKNKDLEPMSLAMKVLEYYLILKSSKDRQSRKEIIKGLTDVNKSWLEERNMLKDIGGHNQ